MPNMTTMMKTMKVVLFLTVCVFSIHVHGQARTSVQRCLCRGGTMNQVNTRNIDKLEIVPAGPSCDRVEIIVTMKNDETKRCLNPASKLAKYVVKKSIQKRSAK